MVGDSWCFTSVDEDWWFLTSVDEDWWFLTSVDEDWWFLTSEVGEQTPSAVNSPSLCKFPGVRVFGGRVAIAVLSPKNRTIHMKGKMAQFHHNTVPGIWECTVHYYEMLSLHGAYKSLNACMYAP